MILTKVLKTSSTEPRGKLTSKSPFFRCLGVCYIEASSMKKGRYRLCVLVFTVTLVNPIAFY